MSLARKQQQQQQQQQQQKEYYISRPCRWQSSLLHATIILKHKASQTQRKKATKKHNN